MEAMDRVQIVVDAAVEHLDGSEHANKVLSMGPLKSWMVFVVLTCCSLVLLATFGAFKYKKMLTYWNGDGSDLVRSYFQKMAIYNVLILAILQLTYMFVFDFSRRAEPNERCLKLGEHKFIAFIIISGSLIVGLIRFLSVGFAHSNAYDFTSVTFEADRSQGGFSVHTSPIFKSFIAPYIKSALLLLFLVVIFLHLHLLDAIRSPILNASFCLSGWRDKKTGDEMLPLRFLPIALIILLPVFSATIIEHFAHIFSKGFYTKTPGYYSILNAPFIMVALTTTWSMWFAILFMVWLTFGLGAGEYFSMLALFYTMWDSFVLFLAAIIVGRKNRLAY